MTEQYIFGRHRRKEPRRKFEGYDGGSQNVRSAMQQQMYSGDQVVSQFSGI